MADETTILALDILDKLGYSGEAAGTGDVFQYLAQLLASVGLTGDVADPAGSALARILDLKNKIGSINPTSGGTDTLFRYLYALSALIGTASPTSGDLTTLFKGLKLIADYVDTLETKVGTNTDAAGTSTLFARLAQIAGYTDQVEGYVDTLESNLGSTGDAASATGSAHAKLVDIKNYLVNTILSTINTVPQKPRGLMPKVSFSTKSTSYVTVLSIGGAGALRGVCLRKSGGYSGDVNLRITIDGNVIHIFSFGSDKIAYPRKNWWQESTDLIFTDATDFPQNSADLYIPFKSSILVELQTTTDSNTAYCWLLYEIQ